MKYTLALATTLLCTTANAQENPPAPPPPAAQPQTDPRLIQALNAVGIKQYAIRPDGSCRILCALPNGRRQGVIVRPSTERFGSLELREIWTVADLKASKLSSDTIIKAMAETGPHGIGAWRIIPFEGTEYGLILAAKLPANVAPKDLGQAIWDIAAWADKA